jgi:hypothetical protein
VSGSRLAYPLNRGADSDAGGAADLQTDVMRFMAILALCLVAIFALVQSLPLVPETPVPVPPVAASAPEPAAPRASQLNPLAEAIEPPRPAPARQATPAVDTGPAAEPAPAAAAPAVERGFTLRFESDLALMRLVAAGGVGLYAIEAARAQRMSVSESRISFWNASTPNTYHEMDANTVPQAVVDALGRSGAEPGAVAWGVTLPGKLSRDLQALLAGSPGGALVIGGDGSLRLEEGR